MSKKRTLKNECASLLEAKGCPEICKIPITSTKIKTCPFAEMRPKPSAGVDYNISETETKLDAGATRIKYKQTTATYAVGTKPKPKTKKKIIYFHGIPPQWEFVDEKWKRRQEELQEIYKEELRQRVEFRKQKEREQLKSQDQILKIAGPDWYQELSYNQMKTAENLKACLAEDKRKFLVCNTLQNLCNLGISIPPKKKVLEHAIDKSNGKDVDFLLCFYQYMNQNRTDYSLNDRLILSAVVHLCLKDTFKELDIRIPHPPPPPPQSRKRRKRKYPIEYESPYLEPYTFKPKKPKDEGIYKHPGIQKPSSQYFTTLDVLKQEQKARDEKRNLTSTSKEELTKGTTPIRKEYLEARKYYKQFFKCDFPHYLFEPTTHAFSWDDTPHLKKTKDDDVVKNTEEEICICKFISECQYISDVETTFDNEEKKDVTEAVPEEIPKKECSCGVKECKCHKKKDTKAQETANTSKSEIKAKKDSLDKCGCSIKNDKKAQCGAKSKSKPESPTNKCGCGTNKEKQAQPSSCSIETKNKPHPSKSGIKKQESKPQLSASQSSCKKKNENKPETNLYDCGCTKKKAEPPVVPPPKIPAAPCKSCAPSPVESECHCQDSEESVKYDPKDMVFLIVGYRTLPDGERAPILGGMCRAPKMPEPYPDPPWSCKTEAQKMLAEFKCQCEYCKDIRKDRYSVNYIISHMKKSESGDHKIKVIGGVAIAKPCNCLAQYYKKLERYEELLQRTQAKEALRQQLNKYIIAGVVMTKDGPVYNLMGLQSERPCECQQRLMNAAASKERLRNMPEKPKGRIQYGIGGVHATPQGNVFVLDQALPIDDCDCMSLYNRYLQAHQDCMSAYQRYVEEMTMADEFAQELDKKYAGAVNVDSRRPNVTFLEEKYRHEKVPVEKTKKIKPCKSPESVKSGCSCVNDGKSQCSCDKQVCECITKSHTECDCKDDEIVIKPPKEEKCECETCSCESLELQVITCSCTEKGRSCTCLSSTSCKSSSSSKSSKTSSKCECVKTAKYCEKETCLAWPTVLSRSPSEQVKCCVCKSKGEAQTCLRCQQGVKSAISSTTAKHKTCDLGKSKPSYGGTSCQCHPITPIQVSKSAKLSSTIVVTPTSAVFTPKDVMEIQTTSGSEIIQVIALIPATNPDSTKTAATKPAATKTVARKSAAKQLTAKNSSIDLDEAILDITLSDVSIIDKKDTKPSPKKKPDPDKSMAILDFSLSDVSVIDKKDTKPSPKKKPDPDKSMAILDFSLSDVSVIDKKDTKPSPKKKPDPDKSMAVLDFSLSDVSVIDKKDTKPSPKKKPDPDKSMAVLDFSLSDVSVIDKKDTKPSPKKKPDPDKSMAVLDFSLSDVSVIDKKDTKPSPKKKPYPDKSIDLDEAILDFTLSDVSVIDKKDTKPSPKKKPYPDKSIDLDEAILDISLSDESYIDKKDKKPYPKKKPYPDTSIDLDEAILDISLSDESDIDKKDKKPYPKKKPYPDTSIDLDEAILDISLSDDDFDADDPRICIKTSGDDNSPAIDDTIPSPAQIKDGELTIDDEKVQIEADGSYQCSLTDLSGLKGKKSPFKRYFFVKKFPVTPKAQMNLLKKALESMKVDKHPLAMLNDCHLLPHFQIWFAYRCNKTWNHDAQLKSLMTLKSLWNLGDNSKEMPFLPDISFTSSEVKILNWSVAEKFRKSLDRLKRKYYSDLKKIQINGTRTFYPTTLDYQFPNPDFKNYFFAYMPSKESDIPAFKNWKGFEFRDHWGAPSCYCK